MKTKAFLVPFIVLLFCCRYTSAQQAYKDSMTRYIARYINEHEVVKGDDRKWLQFFPVDEHYVVNAKFEPAGDNRWFSMKTSDGRSDINRVYGTLHFTIHDTAVTLRVYQSKDLLDREKYKDYLFLPFTDLTSGNETYANGRYIDLTTKDIRNGIVTIDFNKAYNPYCAYVSGRYSCPVPPHENDLPVTIKAGEKVFVKKHYEE